MKEIKNSNALNYCYILITSWVSHVRQIRDSGHFFSSNHQRSWLSNCVFVFWQKLMTHEAIIVLDIVAAVAPRLIISANFQNGGLVSLKGCLINQDVSIRMAPVLCSVFVGLNQAVVTAAEPSSGSAAKAFPAAARSSANGTVYGHVCPLSQCCM